MLASLLITCLIIGDGVLPYRSSEEKRRAGKELQVRCLRGSACARACFAFGRLCGCSVGMSAVRLATSRGPPPPPPPAPTLQVIRREAKSWQGAAGAMLAWLGVRTRVFRLRSAVWLQRGHERRPPRH